MGVAIFCNGINHGAIQAWVRSVKKTIKREEMAWSKRRSLVLQDETNSVNFNNDAL